MDDGALDEDNALLETFHVRLGNLVPDSSPVDFLVDGYPVLSDRAFGSINDYTEHATDEYDVGVREHDTEAVLFEELVAFEAGEHSTLLLVGTPEELSMLVLDDGP